MTVSLQGIYAYGYIPLAVFSLLIITVIFLYYVTKPKVNPVKNARYEAGNPPKGTGRGRLGFQYFGYLVLFASIEPVIIILLALAPAISVSYRKTLIDTTIIMAILLPILAYGIKIASNPRLWRWGK